MVAVGDYPPLNYGNIAVEKIFPIVLLTIAVLLYSLWVSTGVTSSGFL